MKLLFAGTPAIAVPSLKAAAAGGGFELAGVLTNPDAARGRRGEAVPSDVGLAASKIASCHPERRPFAVIKSAAPDEECFRSVREVGADLLVTFAYGAIFPPEFLELFPLGGINVHPSLLPKYRGAAPIPAAILNRDSETGITIQRIAAELDSGNVLFQETVPLSGRETAASLGADMAEKGAALLVCALCAIAEGAVSETPQDDSVATFCGKIKRQDGLIDWRLDAASIDARIRAFTPWPLSYTRHGNAELYILEAAPYYGPVGADTASGAAGAVIGTDRNAGIVIKTGNGLLAARHLQYSARKALDWRSFLNGARNFIGSTLG